jgi:hypothetical protein
MTTLASRQASPALAGLAFTLAFAIFLSGLGVLTHISGARDARGRGAAP